MFYWEAEQTGARILSNAGVDSPQLSSRVLLQYVSHLNRSQLILSHRQKLPPEIEKIYFTHINRRKTGEPLAYIIGEKEFFGHSFSVTPDVLIPRPETEQIIEIALASDLPQNAFFLDACCGSGCIGISLLLEKPDYRGVFLDNSIHALRVCRKNARKYHLQTQIIACSIFSGCLRKDCFDLVVANPPYISPHEKNTVMEEVLQHEPAGALFSAQNGFRHILQILTLGQIILKKHGLLLMEHGAGQGLLIKKYMQSSGYENVEDYHDLAGKPRIAAGRKK